MLKILVMVLVAILSETVLLIALGVSPMLGLVVCGSLFGVLGLLCIWLEWVTTGLENRIRDKHPMAMGCKKPSNWALEICTVGELHPPVHTYEVPMWSKLVRRPSSDAAYIPCGTLAADEDGDRVFYVCENCYVSQDWTQNVRIINALKPR